VHGSLELLDLIAVDNIRTIEISDVGDYEGNMDAHYVITLNNGDDIQFDGYSGLWELKSYDKLTKGAKVKALVYLVDTLIDNIKVILS
jgi:hypothetical protein